MEFEYIVENGEVTITGYTDRSVKSINIPGFIDTLPVTTIRYDSFMKCTYLNKITIPNSVTDIHDCVFWNCTSLKEINRIKLKKGVNLINDRFIYYDITVYKIKSQIAYDYYCEYYDDIRYLIDDKLYCTELIHWMHTLD